MQTQPLTSQFHLWLLAYEFSETVLILNRKKLIFLTSKRKKIILENIPPNKELIDIEVVLREGKKEDGFADITKRIGDLGTVGVYTGEDGEGEIVGMRAWLENKKVKCQDIAGWLDEVYSVKCVGEVEAMRVAAKFTEFVFSEGISKIETVIDEQ